MEKEQRPRQLWLSQAHKDGYLGYWKIEKQDRVSFLIDPEADITLLHDEKERQRLINSVVAKEWREKLKAWGYTQKEIRQRQRASMKSAIENLKKMGVWEEVVNTSSIQDLRLTLQIVKGVESEWVDLDSSEGFTVYPDELSWWEKVHGSIPGRIMEKVRREMKDQVKQLTR
jgi:hypothetical protein